MAEAANNHVIELTKQERIVQLARPDSTAVIFPSMLVIGVICPILIVQLVRNDELHP